MVASQASHGDKNRTGTDKDDKGASDIASTSAVTMSKVNSLKSHE